MMYHNKVKDRHNELYLALQNIRNIAPWVSLNHNGTSHMLVTAKYLRNRLGYIADIIVIIDRPIG